MKALKSVESWRLAAKERLNRLLHQRGGYQAGKVPLRFAAQRGKQGKREEADQEKEDRMANEVIVGTVEDVPKGNAKRWPDGTQLVEREPEDAQQRHDRERRDAKPNGGPVRARRLLLWRADVIWPH